ncbi:unnamed protein product [Echinostoma caproni]|uniref:Ezrin/radixin/moesin C-terminal domain-containing protein n=1 Tax=Echinostoma caproni TaxID=27848 RepID=A0A3P8FTD0_9TREM|nr:unnamed protein product [Echinostoma caproni]
MIFYSSRVEYNQRLLSLCVGAHELYVRRRQPESIELQHMRAQANAEREVKSFERDRLLNALHAQEVAELQLKQLSARLEEDANERERTKKTAEELAKRVGELEAQLAEEAELRRQLEDARKRMELNNKELETSSQQSKEKRNQLLLEQSVIQEEINELSHSVKDSSMRLEAKRAQLAKMNTASNGQPIPIGLKESINTGQGDKRFASKPSKSRPKSEQILSKPTPITIDFTSVGSTPSSGSQRESMINGPKQITDKTESILIPPKSLPEKPHTENQKNSKPKLTLSPNTTHKPPQSDDFSLDSNREESSDLTHSISSTRMSSQSSSPINLSSNTSNLLPMQTESQPCGSPKLVERSNGGTKLPSVDNVTLRSTVQNGNVSRSKPNSSTSGDCEELRFDLNYIYTVHPDTVLQRMSMHQISEDNRLFSIDLSPAGQNLAAPAVFSRHSMYTKAYSHTGSSELEPDEVDRRHSFYFDESTHRRPTLRRIRQGNTKRRIEEFESM